jgi:hypothetical protein
MARAQCVFGGLIASVLQSSRTSLLNVPGRIPDTVCHGGWKDRRHEELLGFAIHNSVRDLLGTLSHQSPPDGISLGPQIFSLVVKAGALVINYYTEGHAIQSGHDASVKLRRAGIDGYGVKLCWVANRSDSLIQEVPQYKPSRIRSASNNKIVGRISPVLAKPIDVRLEPT